VTEFEFALHELGPIVLAGLAMWPVDRAAEILGAWRDYVDGAPDQLSTAFAVLTAPPEPFVPDELKGQTVCGIAAMYVGDPNAGAALIRPIKDLGPAVDVIGPVAYTAFQAMLDPSAPPGMRSYSRGEYLRELTDQAIDALLQRAPGLTEDGFPLTQMVIFRIGQAVAAVPEESGAFSHRDANQLPVPSDRRLVRRGRRRAAHLRHPRVCRGHARVRNRGRVPELHTGIGPGP